MLDPTNTAWDIAVYVTGTAVLLSTAALGAAYVVVAISTTAVRLALRHLSRMYCLPAHTELVRRWYRAGCPTSQIQQDGNLAWVVTRDLSK